MTSMTTGTDPTTLRTTFAGFPSGVTALCAEIDGELVGMAASSFTGVSLDPPLVSVCIMHGSRTWQRLRAVPRLGISVLAADQEAVCRALGSRQGDRFAGVDTMVTPAGAAFVRGAGIWLECEIDAEMPGGDHVIVVLRVLGLDAEPKREPMVYLDGKVRNLVPRSPVPVDRPGPVTTTVPSAPEGVLS